jgi:tripartite-type tricarboxylate transporter receptor subunit TctC
MSKLAAMVAAAALSVAAGAVAAADEWPSRPIRIIAPSTPGGAADLFGRLLCDQFAETFRERCFVENRAGAGGLIGTAAAAQAAPDGYTLTTSSTAYHVIAPMVSANPGFDPIKDFTHIAYIGGPPNVFVAHPALGVRSLADLVALARRQGAIDYVSPGVGTLGHLLAESFAQKSGIRLQQIMTRGASQGLIDLVAGTVKLGTMTWTSALGQVRAGAIVPIAVSSSARLAEFPDLPTFKDQGYGELTAVSWFALSGPAGIPADIVGRLNRAVAAMLEQPAVRRRMARDAIETTAMSPDAFSQFVADEIAKWRPVARRVIAPN